MHILALWGKLAKWELDRAGYWKWRSIEGTWFGGIILSEYGERYRWYYEDYVKCTMG